MIEIDCRKCLNLQGQNLDGHGDSSGRCSIYGPDPAKATRACAHDRFKNYHPERSIDEFKPGMDMWCMDRDGAGRACGIACGIFLARVQDTVIVSPYPDGMTDLDNVLAHHREETQLTGESILQVFLECDCYPTESMARAALAKEIDLPED